MTAVEAPRSARRWSAESLIVDTLCRFLPAGFRPRQRAEWTGDLLELAADGPARRRYLLGAAWTLPQLRAAARRVGGATGAEMAPARPAVRTLAWLLIFGLGLPVLGWYVACLGPYVVLDMPRRVVESGGIDPKDIYPTTGAFVVLKPLWIAALVLSWIAIIGNGLLFGFIGLVALVLAGVRRKVTGLHRLAAAGGGAALLAVAVGGVLGTTVTDRGLTSAVLGLIGGGLGMAGRGLRRGHRTALVIVALAAVTVAVVHRTSFGDTMLTWYLD